ncbi:MAG: hypothetical protein HQ478_11450 [Chloroflexi bacterium]|nr:hypothetical protein [Chloroflexota bacterium]
MATIWSFDKSNIMRLFKGPAISHTEAQRATFKKEHVSRVHAGVDGMSPTVSGSAVYEFLDYVVDAEGHPLHGSADGDVEQFEVRTPDEGTKGFAAQAGVFAASDAIWAIFFGTVDREIATRSENPDAWFSISNMCIKLWPSRRQTHRYYAFGISDWALEASAWRDG